jgi:hypothetical protein
MGIWVAPNMTAIRPKDPKTRYGAIDMPALKTTDHFGEIIWLGQVGDRDAGLRSRSTQSLSLDFAGPAGETHGGLTRPSCSRVSSQYERGTEIRNVRQLSIVSEEELSAIADEMGVARLDPSWFGASVVLRGIPDFSHIPPSSRLQNDAGTTMTIDMQNRPCHLPVAGIKVDHPNEAKGFKAAACGRRGVTAWVEREGQLSVGDQLRLHIPDQRAWLAQS